MVNGVSNDGTLLAQLGTKGTGDEEFDSSHDIAIDSSNKELEELKIRHQQVISFFSDIQDKEDDSAII